MPPRRRPGAVGGAASIARAIAFASIALTPALMLSGCGGAPQVAPGQGVNQTLSLDAGQTVRLDDAALLTFANVVNDNRCPRGATCAWAGTATVRLKLRPRDSKPSDDPWLELLTILNGGVAKGEETGLIPVETAGYVVTLLELRPEPVAGMSVLESSYRAVVRIRKPAG